MSTTMEEPVLALDNIQGNILEGFNKSYQHLLYFKIEKVAGAKRWLRAVMPLITTAATVHRFMREFRSYRKLNDGQESKKLTAAWMNIAFSYPGIEQLLKDIDLSAFSQAFVDGQWRRARSILGDSRKADPCCWIIGGEETIPDILVICAADRLPELEQLVKKVCARIPHGSLIPIGNKEDLGKDLPRSKDRIVGREHFGFKDGI